MEVPAATHCRLERLSCDQSVARTPPAGATSMKAARAAQRRLAVARARTRVKMRQRVYRSYNKEETTSRLFYRRRQNLVPLSQHFPCSASSSPLHSGSVCAVSAGERDRACILPLPSRICGCMHRHDSRGSPRCPRALPPPTPCPTPLHAADPLGAPSARTGSLAALHCLGSFQSIASAARSHSGPRSFSSSACRAATAC